MECDTVIVRYSEIFLKSDHVRRYFTGKLLQNLLHALGADGLEASVFQRRHRIFLETKSPAEVAMRASCVFGVRSTSPAIRASSDIKTLTSQVVDYAGRIIGDGTFAMDCRRAKDYPIDSPTLERVLGAAVVKAFGNKVDLKGPDSILNVEVHTDSAFIYGRTIEGVGGLPYGTQGEVAAEVDGNLDALAAWMMMRRGCTVSLAGDACYATRLSRYSTNGISAHSSIEEAASLNGVCGIVCGQTLRDLDTARDTIFHVPVYRPLIGLDSRQIHSLMSYVS